MYKKGNKNFCTGKNTFNKFHRRFFLNNIDFLHYNPERKHLKPLAGYVYYFSINQAHQNNMIQNK